MSRWPRKVAQYRKPLLALESIEGQMKKIDEQTLRVQKLLARTKPENRAGIMEAKGRLESQRQILDRCRTRAINRLGESVEASHFHPVAAAAAHSI